MAGIGQPIDVAAAPSDDDNDLGIEHREQVPQAAERNAVEVPPFDERDEALAHLCPRPDVGLSEREPMS